MTTKPLTEYQRQRIEAAEALAASSTQPIVKFLEDRLAEARTAAEEKNCGALIHEGGCYYNNQYDPYSCDCDGPQNALADIEAKQRILDEIVPAMNGMDNQIHGEWGVGRMDPADYESVELLKLLAIPYSDHRDYQQQWRP